MNKHSKFDKLGLFYILALSAIALSIIISQIVVQNSISRQQDDSRTINLAGRQRMLSQKISKLALQIGNSTDPVHVASSVDKLKSAVELWTQSHKALLEGDESLGLKGKPSETIFKMYKSIEFNHSQIVGSAREIINQKLESSNDFDLKRAVQNILDHESIFLEGMDGIVFQYDKEAKAKVAQLQNIELILGVLSLIIIAVELIFIFRPIARNVRRTVDELVESEEGSIKLASELSRLYEELVKSYQDLEATGYEPETPLAFATIDTEGGFTYLSRKFRDLMEWEPKSIPRSFITLLRENSYREEFINGLIEILKKNKSWTGEVKLTNAMGDFIWLEMFIIPTKLHDRQNSKIIARNVTDLKEAKMRSSEVNREKIEKKVMEKQYRSVLILEGQEEERKRLGREIHDGLGQMLTALKLSLESVTPNSSVHTKKRLEDTKELMKSIIKEVRRIAFNLTPTSLSDFGVAPAIRKFCQEVNDLSNTEVVFENKTRFVNRMESNIENNIYRIAQEAVNNAIKYAKAQKIKVDIEHTTKELKIIIADDGKGFDYEKMQNSDYFQHSGHGIFNMKERTSFIKGDFDLDSKPGEGTKLSISIPLD